MKTTREMIEVMDAYAHGNKIQMRSNINCGINTGEHKWHNIENPVWNWYLYDYRVEPESEYRPYKDSEECYKDALMQGFSVRENIKGFLSHEYYTIAVISEYGIKVLPNKIYSYAEALDTFVWARDLSPFGIKKD